MVQMNTSHLKKLLIKHGILQIDVARILGRDKSVVTNLLQGKRQLKADEAAVIAKYIGVPVSEVLGVHEPDIGRAMPVLIPFKYEPHHCKKMPNVVKKKGRFYLETSAGEGYSPNKSYALEIDDDSMNMAGILRGDLVISEINRPCKSGQIVIAEHYRGREGDTIIRKYKPSFLLPSSMSSAYKPLSLKDDDIRLLSPVLKLIRIF
jgi:transcriptional regulator with XRE-family HTH domain